MKYIIFETEDDPIGLIFRTDENHIDVAKALRTGLFDDYTFFPRNAGFVRWSGQEYVPYDRSSTMQMGTSAVCGTELEAMMGEGVTVLMLPMPNIPVLIVGPWRLGEVLKKLPARRNFSWGQARTTADIDPHHDYLGKQIKPRDFVMHNNVDKFVLTDEHKTEVEAILNCWDC